MLIPWEKPKKLTYGKATTELYGQIQQKRRNYVDSSTLKTENFSLAFLYDKEVNYTSSFNEEL